MVSIHLPPLRDRREDIPELVSVLLAKHAKRLGKRVDGVDNATIRGLMARRLDGQRPRARQRAGARRHPERRTDPDPRRFPARPDRRSRAEEATGDNLRAAVRDYERHHIQRVLRDCGDDKREAARRLGLGLSSLYRKLEEMGIRT